MESLQKSFEATNSLKFTAQTTTHTVQFDFFKIENEIEYEILELLRKEGPMPLWKIAQKVGEPRENVIPVIQKLFKENRIVAEYEKEGVKMWKILEQ